LLGAGLVALARKEGRGSWYPTLAACKIRLRLQKVSGHDFSRAERATKTSWALQQNHDRCTQGQSLKVLISLRNQHLKSTSSGHGNRGFALAPAALFSVICNSAAAKAEIKLAFCGPAKQAAEKATSEGDGGFNPRVKLIELTVALATGECFSPILPENPGCSAACKVVP
jgi:hypothetical protein